jgi:hypothetical protein
VKARAPKTSWNRRGWAWARGVYDRLENAQARREACYGRPDKALAMAFGWRTARAIIMASLRSHPDPFERLEHYREVVCRYIAPGGVRLWPDEDPF